MNARRNLDADFRVYAMRSSRSLHFAPSGLVYIIVDEAMVHVKIGRTRCDVRHRMSSLQTSTPSALRLLFVLRGDVDLERELHVLFAAERVRGEWFRFRGEVAVFVVYCLAYQAQTEGTAA